jgi:hypothetical protein
MNINNNNQIMNNNQMMHNQIMNNTNQMMNNNNNQEINNSNHMMSNNNQMNINNISFQNQNMDNDSLRIKKIIKPYEEKIKILEEQIRQKDFEIICLKDKLDKNFQNNQNGQMFNMFSMMEQYKLMNQMNNEMSLFNQKNNNMNQMNLFNQMNINMNQKMNEIKNLYLSFKIKIKEKESMIKVQCRSNEKIIEAIKRFKIKLCDDSKQFYFFYNGKKIINFELTLDEYGINDESIIFAVEKNDINNILKIN